MIYTPLYSIQLYHKFIHFLKPILKKTAFILLRDKYFTDELSLSSLFIDKKIYLE